MTERERLALENIKAAGVRLNDRGCWGNQRLDSLYRLHDILTLHGFKYHG